MSPWHWHNNPAQCSVLITLIKNTIKPLLEKFSEKNDFFKTLAEKLSTKTYEHFAESFLVVFYNTCITLK